MSYKIQSVRAYGNKYNRSYITGSTESVIEVEIKIPSNTEDRKVSEIDAELRALLDKAMKGLVDPPKVYLPNPEGWDYHASPTPEDLERWQKIKDEFYSTVTDTIKQFHKKLFDVMFPPKDPIEETASQTEYNILGWTEKPLSSKDMVVIAEGEINSPEVDRLDFFDMLLNPAPKKEKEVYIVSVDVAVWPNENTKMMYMVPGGFIGKDCIVQPVDYCNPLNPNKNRFPADDEQPENWYLYGWLNPVDKQFYVQTDDKRFFLKMYADKPIKEGIIGPEYNMKVKSYFTIPFSDLSAGVYETKMEDTK